MKVCLAEQLEDIEGTRGKMKRVERLKEYDSPHLRILLDLCYNPNIKIEIDETRLKYAPSRDSEISMVHRLKQEAAKLKNLTNVGPYPNLDKGKRTGILVKILETVHPKDAILLLNVVKKELPYVKFNEETVRLAWPDLTANWGPWTPPKKGDDD